MFRIFGGIDFGIETRFWNWKAFVFLCEQRTNIQIIRLCKQHEIRDFEVGPTEPTNSAQLDQNVFMKSNSNCDTLTVSWNSF